MDDKLKPVEIGFHVSTEESGEECGAVRAVAPGGRDEVIVYIENSGNFIVPSEAVRSVQDAKVILDSTRLDERLRNAIAQARSKEKLRS